MRRAALLLLAIAVAAHGRELQQVSTAILNGRDAEAGRFPYIANMRFPLRGEVSVAIDEFVCTGVLIKPDIVLTSAWCVVNSGVWPKIRLGVYKTNGAPAEVRSVVATAWHADYSGAEDSVTDDVALMLLNKPSKIKPVAYPSAQPNNQVKRSKLTIAGWGLTADDPAAVANNLKTGSQFLLSQQRCAQKWSVPPFPVQAGGWSSGKIMCGAYSGHNKALCWGDAGAPLIRRGNTAAGDLIVGIGSQSDCKGPGILGGSIYSNTGYYHGWISNGIRILRKGIPGYAKWKVARKANFPPSSTCKNVGRRCVESNPRACCSGKCFVWTCMP